MSWLSMSLALILYVAAAFGLLLLCRIWVRPLLPGQPGRLLMVMLAVVLLTPGFSDATGTHFGPACIGVLFSIMTHSLTGLLRSVLPILLVGAVACGWVWWSSRDAAAQDEEYSG